MTYEGEPDISARMMRRKLEEHIFPSSSYRRRAAQRVSDLTEMLSSRLPGTRTFVTRVFAAEEERWREEAENFASELTSAVESQLSDLSEKSGQLQLKLSALQQLHTYTVLVALCLALFLLIFIAFWTKCHYNM